MSFLFFLQSKKSFKGELPEEETILVRRKHWFVLFFPSLFFLLFSLLPFLIYFFIKNFNWYNIFSSLFWFLVVVYFSFLWILLFYSLMLYFLSVVIVTNKRLIRIETKGFFKYERDEMKLERIQDISVKIEGFFASVLNFGDLNVQTAGAVVKFDLRQLPHPQEIKKIILQLAEKLSEGPG